MTQQQQQQQQQQHRYDERRSESATVLTKKYAYRGTVDAGIPIVPSAPTTISKDHSTAVLRALTRRFDSPTAAAAVAKSARSTRTPEVFATKK